MKLGSGFNIKGYIYSGSAPRITGGDGELFFEYINKNSLREINEIDPQKYFLTGKYSFLTKINETCHGINYSNISDVGKLGNYNFYHAPYGAGYYHPAFGEFPTIAEQIGESTIGLNTKKSASALDLADYLKIFGLRITSSIKNFEICKNYSLTAFHEGTSDCPITSKPAVKYSELEVDLSAGSYLGSIGGNIYNHNPFPSSYDRGISIYNSAYQVEKKILGGEEKCVYSTGEDGKPIPSYARSANIVSNNYAFGRCESLSDLDRSPLSIGAVDPHYDTVVPQKGGGGTPDGALGQDTSNYDQSIYWNFIFKNNHETLPFGNTHETAQGMVLNNDLMRENHWWEHRECPENIDYLNHAYGNNLNACPSNYLDIPYYASLGKFGYFGARFQDTWRFISNEGTGVGVGDSDRFRDYPEDPDEEYYSRALNIGGHDYDALLKNAAVEKTIYDFSMTDQIFFLKLNESLVSSSSEYKTLQKNISNWQAVYNNLVFSKFDITNPSYDSNTFEIANVKRGISPDFSDDPIKIFSDIYLQKEADRKTFDSLLTKYGFFKKNQQDQFDTDWYAKLNNEKRRRIAKEYYSRIVSGMPVDLFPNNEITFSFEKYKDFANSIPIKYGSASFKTRDIPDVKRSYFSTSLTSDLEYQRLDKSRLNSISSDESLSAPLNNNFIFSKNTSRLYDKEFYGGYVNPRGVAEEALIPSRAALYLINLPNSGPPFFNQGQANQGPSVWNYFAPETNPPHTFATEAIDKSPIRGPWFTSSANYNRAEINQRYSCFSPLILQQPRKETVKYSQAPKFRIYALDYHSIPEEKIKDAKNGAYPEILFWLGKLKLISSKNKNLYPLKYKWFRVLKSSADNYWKTKAENLLDPQNPEGLWCCAEGDGPDCTVIRPRECITLNNEVIQKWSPETDSEENCRKFTGAKIGDDNYYYFCRVYGRFGWRDSEFAEIEIEKEATLTFALLSNVSFYSKLSLKIAGKSYPLSPSGPGMIPDADVYFEQVKLETWNDVNNCMKTTCIGPEGVRGVTRVWTPSTMTDPRGKNIVNSRWKEFGELVDLKITDLGVLEEIFSKRALPYCDRGKSISYDGVPIELENHIHRTALVPAMFSDYPAFGIRTERIRNISELYPPLRDDVYRALLSQAKAFGVSELFNPGHGQFEENLGCIKKYSIDDHDYNDESEFGIRRAAINPPQHRSQDIPYLCDKFENGASALSVNGSLTSRGNLTITGPECGYVHPSMGRLVHFYVETFDTYYSLCEVGGIKPKKVKNLSHISGGLRSGRPGLQYSFIGRPSDSRLKWTSMPGPYAFQWKVERHNRDRNGNGMPLCFWSYNWEQRIENFYDAAAVYGAVKKMRPTNVANRSGLPIRTQRNLASTSLGASYPPDQTALRNISIGPDDGTKLGCGSIRWKHDGDTYKPNSEFVEWMERVVIPASADPMSNYGCNSANNRDCFLPCISLKYPEGFSPKGGKKIGYKTRSNNSYSSSAFSSTILDIRELTNYDSFRLNGENNYYTDIYPTQLSPCLSNKKDLCNYLTPTIHIGIDTYPISNGSIVDKVINSYRNF